MSTFAPAKQMVKTGWFSTMEEKNNCLQLTRKKAKQKRVKL